MDENRINQLADKFLKGTITDTELQQLEEWFADNDEAPVEVASDAYEADLQYRIYSKIAERGNLQSEKTKNRRRLWPRIAAAASVIFILGFGGYFYFRQQAAPTTQVAQNDIQPGKNTATLTLANGKKIVLSDAVKGQIANEGGVSISKTANGQVVYTIADNNTSAANQFNTLSTANGETYKVNLPDGTQVWLNAATAIRYPENFKGKERAVELLYGEAYFEVVHNAISSFKVISSNQVIEDIGTHFNVKAYKDEIIQRTTLLEGSVKVSVGNKSAILKPGQQSQAPFNGTNVTVQVLDGANAEEAVAWKNGYFRFNDENIQAVMRQLSRWYNIEVNYEGKISDEGYYGKISRFKNISQVLKMLEKTKAVHFKVDGRRVTVIQ